MSLTDRLKSREKWLEYREYKSYHGCMSNRDMRLLDEFINGRRYESVADRFGPELEGLSVPVRRVINKSGSRKKRVVYTFEPDEMYVLKLITWMLYKYDEKIHPSCYSFRRNMTAKKAIGDILAVGGLDTKYILKADIHDYFNSMPYEGMKTALEETIDDDPEMLEFLLNMYGRENARDRAGAMAGVPVSAFMANIFLMSLDRLFESRNIPYFRYSDDIIVIADSGEQLEECRKLLTESLTEKGLSLNEEKTRVFTPGEGIEFLGVRYKDGKIDLADATKKKMKDKIRRKCRSLYRWRIKKGFDFDKAAKVVIRIFNMKYFDSENFMDFTWSRWFFPVLTTDAGLHELDLYLVNELRYIYSGRHYKGNYAVTYEHLKELGFRSLVNEYYAYKKSGFPGETAC